MNFLSLIYIQYNIIEMRIQRHIFFGLQMPYFLGHGMGNLYLISLINQLLIFMKFHYYVVAQIKMLSHLCVYISITLYNFYIYNIFFIIY